MQCYAIGCKRGKRRRFFRVPADLLVRKKWIAALGFEPPALGFEPPKNARVCSRDVDSYGDA